MAGFAATKNGHAPHPTDFGIGPFRLSGREGVLYLRDELVALTPKAVEVLRVLAEHVGEIVTRQDLIDRVWDSAAIEDTNITKNISILRKVLRDELGVDPIRTVSKRGYQLVVAVTALDGAVTAPDVAVTGRPAGAGAPAESAAVVTTVDAAAPRGRRWSLHWMIVLCGFALALMGVWTLRARRLPRPRSSVAVISFHDLSGKPENAWLSRAVSEMLTTELDADDKLRTLPGDVTAGLRAELALPDQNGFSDETLARIRRAADCDYVISGSYLSIDNKVRLDVRVQETDNPGGSAAFVFSGTEKDLPELAARAGAGIRARFGSGQTSRREENAEGMATGAVGPSEPQLRRVYFEALDKLRTFDPAGAGKMLEAVTAKEPGFATGHLQLSTALLQTGYELRAKEEARRAFELSSRLRTDERLAVEARYREMNGEWPRAAEIYTSLWTFHPDNPDYGFSLARVQAEGGTGNLAQRTLARLGASASGEIRARAGLANADLSAASGSFAAAATGYSAVIPQARALGARLLEGRAQAGQALAAEKTGDFPGARSAWLEAIRLCTQVGDSGCVASALNNESVLLLDNGDIPAGLEVIEKALQVARESGNRGQEARAINIRGLALNRQGDVQRARAEFDEFLAIARETGSPKLMALGLRRVADAAANTGDRSTALRDYTELAKLARASDDRLELASALDSTGRLKQRQGDLRGARLDLEESLRIRRELKADSSIPGTLSFLAVLSKNMGDVDEAVRLRTEECKGLESLSRKDALPRCKAALAELDLLRERYREAAAEALVLTEAGSRPTTRAEAYRILALARLGLGDLAGAGAAIGTARTLLARSDDLTFVTPVTIASGRIEAGMGHKAEAASLFRRAMEQAKKEDTFSMMLETRLAVAEAAVRNGDGTAGKQLSDLVAESKAKGYGGVAARAQRLQGLVAKASGAR